MKIKQLKILKNKKMIIPYLAFIFILWLSFWGENVEIFKVKRTTSVQGVTVTGTVQTVEINNIAPEVTAVIIENLVTENDEVKKGQILTKLEDASPKAVLKEKTGQLNRAKAALKDLKTEPRKQSVAAAAAEVQFRRSYVQKLGEDLKRVQIELRDYLSQELRLKKLYEEGAVSFREYEEAKFKRMGVQKEIDALKLELQQHRNKLLESQHDYELIAEGPKKEKFEEAKANIEALKGSVLKAKGDLEKYTLKSPVDGFIRKVILDAGSVASPSSPVMIMGTTQIHVVADVDEDQIDKVKIGQNAYIIFDAYPDKAFESKVTKIIKVVDPKTGTFITYIEIPDLKKKPFIPGMTADITIITQDDTKALIIPDNFVYQRENQNFVYVKLGLWAFKRNIKGQSYDNNRFVVTEGLKARETIIKPMANIKLQNLQKIKTKKIYKLNE